MKIGKNVRLGELFSEFELRKALAIWQKDRDHFHDRVLVEIIRPAQSRINIKTGQENDPSYLAYMLGYLITLLDGS